MDVGAKGDGVNDDTAAFQKALDLMSAASGGIVFAPRGTKLPLSLRRCGKFIRCRPDK